jgi:hypothetical protein
MAGDDTPAVSELPNDLLGIYWMSAAQHQTHVALLDAWGISGTLTAHRMTRPNDDLDTGENDA